MWPDPKPVKHVTFKQTERAITAGDPDRPDAADFLEAKRIVMRIANPELICFSRTLLYVSGKRAKCRQNSAVVEDFIQRFHTAGRDIGFGLSDKIVQSSCFDVLLDLSVPCIFECFLKPTGKLPLLCRGKPGDSLLNFSHRTHASHHIA
jgi:hypothetical protein